jgi:hypothetical protein
MARDEVLDTARTAELIEAARANRHDDVWRLAADLSDVAISRPSEIWLAFLEALDFADDESRMALATNLLEHMVQEDFTFFDRIESEIKGGNRRLALALTSCWKFGAANEPENAKRWDELVEGYASQREK